MKSTAQTEKPSATAEKIAHTPGPWSVVEPQPELHNAASQIIALGDGSPEPIAHALPIGHTQERNANARLIASAPELLEACKFFLGAIADGDIVRDISKDARPEWALKMMKLVSELQKAELAVAKTEGRAS